jgi:hypothetical protein
VTGPGVPYEVRPLARTGTAQQRRITGGGCGAGSPEHHAERAVATHKPCPIDGCPGPARLPMQSSAHPPTVDHGGADQDMMLCQRCGATLCVRAEV